MWLLKYSAFPPPLDVDGNIPIQWARNNLRSTLFTRPVTTKSGNRRQPSLGSSTTFRRSYHGVVISAAVARRVGLAPSNYQHRGNGFLVGHGAVHHIPRPPPTRTQIRGARGAGPTTGLPRRRFRGVESTFFFCRPFRVFRSFATAAATAKP